jgi:uncharacterized protein YbjT (DUF2867 family)
MFTILGATGNTGSKAAETLLAKGAKVRVLVRNAQKASALKALGAEIVEGDVHSESDLMSALHGAEGAYMLLPPDMKETSFLASRRIMAERYASVLRETRVGHVAFLSSVGAQHNSGTGPIQSVHFAEQVLSGLPETRFTFIRAAYFMENFLASVHPMKADGVLPVFGGGEAYPFEMVATKDIGAFAAQALLAPPAATQIIQLHAAQTYSHVDVARESSKLLGREVVATPLPIEAMIPAFMSFGISEDVAKLYRELTEGTQKGRVAYDGKGRTVPAPTTLEGFLAQALA